LKFWKVTYLIDGSRHHQAQVKNLTVLVFVSGDDKHSFLYRCMSDRLAKRSSFCLKLNRNK